MMRFVDRKAELQVLEEWARKGKTALIFGRRRVGKSRLVQEFLKGKKSVYLLATDKGEMYNLRKFSQELSKIFDIPGLRFTSFTEMFDFLGKQETKIIVIDEFGYIVKSEALGEFQEIVENLPNHKRLILTGSSVSLIESKLLGYKSPLYGRLDLIKKIHPLPFQSLFEWFPSLSVEDAVKIYAVTNAIPRYLEFFDKEDILEEIEEKMFNPDLLLFRDTKMLLEEELPEPARYFLILEAIAFGKNTLTEISGHSKVEINQVPYYLAVLRNLGFVKHEKPVLEKKKGIYVISDTYMQFWFRFISPFFEEIEAGMHENAIQVFHKEFNSFLGIVFEKICQEVLANAGLFSFSRIGKWWHKDKEIDLVALNEPKKEILFGECKWQENVNAKKVLKELKEKTELVQWHNKERKELFVLFAKSFKEKIKEFEGKRVYCFDLEDLERFVR